jgi:hypothetical protein
VSLALSDVPRNFAPCEPCVALCRDEIASCSESAYSSLRLADAQKLMMFKSPKEAEAYAKQVCARVCCLRDSRWQEADGRQEVTQPGVCACCMVNKGGGGG